MTTIVACQLSLNNNTPAAPPELPEVKEPDVPSAMEFPEPWELPAVLELTMLEPTVPDPA